ncbi:MAG: FAD-dependent oxidoreductase [Bacteroidales bacterium]|nr:FAD-dependent oxidoreductase [Bacteroidales bacterium]
MKRLSGFVILLPMLIACAGSGEYDVCVYGGNSASVMAAYSAAQMGSDVVVVSPDMRVGGLTTGGLGYTDIGNKQAVVGVAKQFYRKIGEHYGKLEQWVFEPSVALEIMEQYLDHPRIKVYKGYRLDEVVKDGTDITSISAVGENGDTLVFSARNFVDGTYEGDLMAKAGVSYHVGREANEVYGETWNGVQLMKGHQFPDGVDPYVVKGRPDSGLLWGISTQSLLPDGSADTLVQAYNYRICLTDSLENMVPITRPENYDSTRYELLLRLFAAQPDKRELNQYFIWSRMPGRKTDINNRGGFSSDMIGMNYNYPEATYEQRQAIIKAHTDYTKGLLYFYGHDERVPAELRQQMLQWGYPKDEYVENGHWTPQLYVREVRRMVGEYVATQKDCEGKADIKDGIAMAAYNMDSHNCQRIVVEKDGKAMVKNEGNVEIPGGYPYPISYRCLTPKREECTNLLVPACLSSSHIAFGSIRMEPVFMALGQASGIAAALARNGVQSLDASLVQEVMRENPFMDGSEPEILIDDSSDAVMYSGLWKSVKGRRGFGPTYLELKGKFDKETLEYRLPEGLSGEYDLYSYQQVRGRLNPVTHFDVHIGDMVYNHTFNIKDMPVIGQTSGDWHHVGTFSFGKKDEAYVSVYSEYNGMPLRADALLLIKKDK